MAGSKRPKQPEPLPPPPKREDPAVQEALAESIRRRSRARGFRSTILASRMLENQPLKTEFGSA